MRKQRIYGNLGKCLFLAAALSFTLTGCGGSSSKEIALKNDCYEAYKELDAGNWDKAIELFSAKADVEEPEYIALLGLAKAQIGAEEWESAKDTLQKATDLYPEEATAFIYQGATARQLEDYDLAAESYYMAVKLELERTGKNENETEEAGKEKNASRNVQIRDLFVESIDQMQDVQSGYGYAKELYEMEPSDTKLLRSLMWAAARLDTEEAKTGVKEAAAGQPQEYMVTTLIRASDALKAGNKEEAENLLFDVYHAEDWEGADALRFGYPTGEKGEMQAVGGQKVFGKDGLILGTYVNGNWNGPCEAWYGRISDSTIHRNEVEYKGKYYYNYQFSGNWREGMPEGDILYRSDRHGEYVDYPYDQNHYEEVGNMTFTEGKAQGRTEINEYVARADGPMEYSSTTVHEFKDGWPQPFSADTEDGTKMVYEFIYSEQYGWTEYEEQDCGHAYIWKE